MLVKMSRSKPRKQNTAVPFAIHQLCNPTIKDKYRETLTQQLEEIPHNTAESAEHNWKNLKRCILTAAELSIGRAKKSQPDWFLESAHTIIPLLESKNRAHNKLLQYGSPAHRKEFRRHQRKVKVAIDKAKEEWIQKVALEGENSTKDGRTRWKSIRKLQMAHAGRKPTRPTAVLKENGELTENPEEVRARWHRHFTKILNVPSEFSDEVIHNMQSQPTHWDLDVPPH